MFETHSRIVFRSGTGARRPSLKCLRNPLCVAITDSLFLKNVSTTKPRYSPDQLMALSENGKTTANQRDPSHHCTPSTAQAVTPPNVGVISAAPCILQKMIHGPSNVKSWWNRSPFSSLTAPRFLGRILSESLRNTPLQAYYTPYLCRIVQEQAPYHVSFLPYYFLKKLVMSFWRDFHGAFST